MKLELTSLPATRTAAGIGPYVRYTYVFVPIWFVSHSFFLPMAKKERQQQQAADTALQCYSVTALQRYSVTA